MGAKKRRAKKIVSCGFGLFGSVLWVKPEKAVVVDGWMSALLACWLRLAVVRSVLLCAVYPTC